MRVIGYSRVSTDKQRDNGMSLGMQRDKIGFYAQLHDLTLVTLIEDAGESAKSLHRPGLQQALAMLDRGEAEGLLITKLDRLTRSLRDLDTLIHRHFNKGTALMSTCENIDTRTAAGRMVLNVLTTVSQWEREVIAERTIEAASHKKAKGERFGKVPYGKKVGKDGRTLVNAAYEQEVIAAIRRMHQAGLSIRGITAELKRLGYHNREENPFQPTQIHRIIKSLGDIPSKNKNKISLKPS